LRIAELCLVSCLLVGVEAATLCGCLDSRFSHERALAEDVLIGILNVIVFPLNNYTFDVDLNDDGRVDRLDVKLVGSDGAKP
jgi:hypothetical protein